MAEQVQDGSLIPPRAELCTQRQQDNSWIEAVRALSPILTLLVVVIVMTLGNASFLNAANREAMMVQVAVLLIIALGSTFVILTGSIDISFAEIANLVSLVVAVTIGHFGYLAFLLGILAGVVAGLFNGLLFVKGRIPSMVVTLGTTGLWSGIAYTLSGGPPISLKDSAQYLTWIIGTTLGLPNQLLIALVLLAILYFIQCYTWFGRSVYAVGAGEAAARLSGIRVDHTKILVFVVSGVCAAVGGIVLSARVVAGSPVLSAGFLLYVLAAVLIGGTAISGGMGGVLRTLIGVLIITALRNGMTIIGVDIYAQQLVLGVMLVVAVIFTIDRSKLGSIK